MDRDLENEVCPESFDSGKYADSDDVILRFEGESQIKVLVKKSQSEFNPVYASPLNPDVNFSNCMFIIIHEAEIGKRVLPLIVSNTDQLNDIQYESYLEFSKKASDEIFVARQSEINSSDADLNWDESEGRTPPDLHNK